MRALTALTSVAVLVAGAFAKPLLAPLEIGNSTMEAPSTINYSGSDLAVNVTTDEPDFSATTKRFKCKLNFAPGRNLTDLEADYMTLCYDRLLSHTQWYNEAYNCPGAGRIWQIFGVHWSNPEHCWAATKDCIPEAISMRAANVMFYQMRGPLAICYATYGLGPPF
ncbi:hypothetical protein F5Y13DRAFT_190359 [Hypoxylon sp. FL1857]|nr:hypothetical protein F5Y13DRAFT_190359 [Hypoxylon sp. FL1857]